ncbi:Lrp/AsnC family transcriptional regulator [Candidatus Woesearchaeota archaeon]|nr:Lrp/AsnC family transcriptional regulator [Candidatus Woesearchaeota archaeon]
MANLKIDNLDKEIIRILIDDSRLSYRRIAKKLKVSAATIINRVKRLEKEKIIKGYTAKVDYEKLGYDIDVLIEIKISKGNLFLVEKKIASNQNVIAVYDVTGESDAVILARFTTRRKMDNFLKKIQTYDFVERTHTKLILNTIKDDRMRLE